MMRSAAIAGLVTGLILGLCGVAQAATHVVDQKHRRASDANPGTKKAPFKTIGKGVAAAGPGDTVLVKAGTYPELVTIAGSGTQDKPITLRAEPGVQSGAGRKLPGGSVILRSADGRHGITWSETAAHIVIDGFVVAPGKGCDGRETGIGSRAKGAHHIEIRNCVLVGTGIRLSNQSHVTVRHCIQTGTTGNGVRFIGCRDCLLEECEIFANEADGITVSHKSDNVRVIRNYVHDHWKARHPDGMQLYRGVTKLQVEGNLFFNSGQGFMTEEAEGGVFRNNMIAGTHHSGLLLGHSNTHDYDVDGNTIVFTAYKAIAVTGKNHRFRNNVIMTGGDRKLIQGGRNGWRSDYNLFWKPPEGSVKHRTPEGQDAHSRFTDPKFRNAPPLNAHGTFYIDKWGKSPKQDQCTPGKLYLQQKPVDKYFSRGDCIEVSFDGVMRTVTEVTGEYVAFKPPLKSIHQHHWETVVNWKANKDFRWDLRLAESSPGKGMGEGGRDVGSTIDIQAYRRGDFNGDGRRDLPPFPSDVAPGATEKEVTRDR